MAGGSSFPWASGGNTDIYVVNADGGAPQRLTSAPGADTSPSYSPDGRRIVFESDRSGTQQLYVMDADGSRPAADQLRRRPLRLAGVEPARRPHRLHPHRRQLQHRRHGARRAAAQRILTDGWQDEGPSWAPNGQFVMFNRIARGSGATTLYAVQHQRRRRPAHAHPAGRFRPQLVAAPELNPTNSKETEYA